MHAPPKVTGDHRRQAGNKATRLDRNKTSEEVARTSVTCEGETRSPRQVGVDTQGEKKQTATLTGDKGDCGKVAKADSKNFCMPNGNRTRTSRFVGTMLYPLSYRHAYRQPRYPARSQVRFSLSGGGAACYEQMASLEQRLGPRSGPYFFGLNAQSVLSSISRRTRRPDTGVASRRISSPLPSLWLKATPISRQLAFLSSRSRTTKAA